VTTSIRLLGPVAVLVDGRPVDLGPARQRSLLAILLLAAGHPLGPDELALRLWGEQPPDGARESLRAYVCRLRVALAPTGISLPRRSGGYATDLERDGIELDLDAFRRLASQARRAQADGDDQGAVATFDRALALWTADALGGVASSWLDARRDALAMERHAVVLDHADVALAVGEHVRLVGSLSECAAAEPYDERLAAQLLLALHRSGRTAQALAHYRGLRRRLRDDLGTEPGPALRAVHQRVLDGEPLPNQRVPGDVRAARPATVVPHLLPPVASGFVDRADELEALDRALAAEGGPVTVVLSGAGGIGKTSLAVRWARDRAGHFPDGELFVDLRGFDPERPPLAAETALRVLLLALGADAAALPADLDGLTGRYRSLAASRRLLVVADNARSAEQVRPLVPPGVGSLLVVTSRSRLAGLVGSHAARPVPVRSLDDDSARAMLAARLGAELLSADPESVEAILEHCAGLPLALAVVAARAAVGPRSSLAELAAEIREEDARLDALSAGEPRTDLRATLAVSLAALTSSSSEAFALFGLVPGRTFDVEEAAVLLGSSTVVARRALADLTAHHLVEDAGQGRLRMHDLVRLYAVGLARDHQGSTDARRRLLEHYRSAGAVPQPRVPSVYAAVGDAVDAGLDDLACDLAGMLVDHLGGRGCWSELVRIAETARDAATRLGDPARLTMALLALGRGLIGRDDFAAAADVLARATELADRLGDLRLRAEAQRVSARSAALRGLPGEAVRHDRRGLLLYRHLGDRLGEAIALNAVAWHEAHLGRPSAALRHGRDALAILAGLDAPVDTAATLDTVGFALGLLGREGEARDHYRRALPLCVAQGRVVLGATVMEHLAASCDRSGDGAGAWAAKEQAASMLESTGLLAPGIGGGKGWEGVG
jgi:DNA-binding SARP family transcriptional activator